MTRFLLHTDSGMPYIPSNFIPDTGLASLAACLEDAGHDVDILDRNTLEGFRDLTTPEIRNKLVYTYNALAPIISGKKSGIPEKLGAAINATKLLNINRNLERHKDKLYEERAAGLAKRVARRRIDVVGFKYFFGGVEPTIAACREIKKKRPETILIAGGPLVDIAKVSPSAIFEANPYLDLAVYGDGEETIVDIADRIKSGRDLKDIPNTIFRDGTDFKLGRKRMVRDLDDLPLPLYRERDSGQFGIRVIETSRGCPGRCPFCTHGEKSGKKRRTKSKKRILAEIEAAIRDGMVGFIDGSSNPDLEIMQQVAREMISKQLTIKYSMFGSAQDIDIDAITEFARSGLASIFFGFETGDPDRLSKIVRKSKDSVSFIEKLETAVKACSEAGIYPIGSLIHPLPFETRESAENTFEASKRIFGNRGSMLVNSAVLYPFSEWGSDPEQNGFRMKVNYPRAYVMKNLGYRLKPLLPPFFWEDPGYQCFCFGKYRSFRQFTAETGNFQKRLEGMGVTTRIAHDTHLIGSLYKQDMHPAEFMKVVRRALFTGDFEKISEIIETV